MAEKALALPNTDDGRTELVRHQWTVPDVLAAASGIAASQYLKRKSGGTSEKEIAATTTVLLLTARDLGLPPMAALPHMHMIDGTVSLSPHLFLGLIQRAKGPNDRIDIDEGDGYCSVTMTRPGGLVTSYTSRWDRARASKARLSSRGAWQAHEAAMLRVRAIGEAARVVWPDVIMGLYVEGEVIEGEWTATEVPSAPAERRSDIQDTDEPDQDAIELRERVKRAMEAWSDERKDRLNKRLKMYGKPIVKLSADEREDLTILLDVLDEHVEVVESFPGAEECESE